MAEPYRRERAGEELLARNKERDEATRKAAQERLGKGRPTPTQEEMDYFRMTGVNETEDDGSGPEEHTRHLEPASGGQYRTRQARAESQHQPPTRPA
jgi:hypothetical protein